MATLATYLDWSDRGFEKYEVGRGGKFADLDFSVDGDRSPTVYIHLRRDSKSKRDFTIIVDNDTALRDLYEALKTAYGEED